MILPFLLLAAIELTGVIGDGLTARAFFDANNVKVGDPLILTVDFLGSADFTSLHPPALSRQVDRADWKVDDVSAKTDTYRDARRLTYRVRPMREGVLWFPALEFSYHDANGVERSFLSNEIPVHAKPGEQVVVEDLDLSAVGRFPEPDALALDPPAGLTIDEDFAWRKACSSPTADAFAAFDFPAARLNEARCAVLAGEWQRALKIYGRLEWSIGQTPAVERGIVAALARKFDSPAVELPMWRQILRPVLRFAWKGRLAVLLAGGVLLALCLFLVRRLIRAIAVLAFALLLLSPSTARADLFQQMEQMMERQRQQMEKMMESATSMSFSFGGEDEPSVPIAARLRTEPETLQVGEPFEFIVELEAPKGYALDQLRLSAGESFGLTMTGRIETMTDVKSANPSNVIHRLAVPVRYDVPFKGPLTFIIDGMVSGRRSAGGRRGFNITFSNSFRVESEPIDLEIRPLPTAGQPDDFSGIVATSLVFSEKKDLVNVETNDVIQITYALDAEGYVPKGYRLPDTAFEMSREEVRGGGAAVKWRRYFVADGAVRTPTVTLVYYDPGDRTYKRVEAGGSRVIYHE